MVEGHCAKRYADGAKRCVGRRVVEIIWRANPQNQANVERAARGRRLVAVECVRKQVFMRFVDDAAAAPTPAPQTRKRSSSVVDLTADSDDDLVCQPKKRARTDEGVVDLTAESGDDENAAAGPAAAPVPAPATPLRAPGAMLVELRFGIKGKLEVAASAKRSADFQFALRLDSGQYLVFKSDDAPATISSDVFARLRAELAPVDLCGAAFRHGALTDALVATFRDAAGTVRTAKAVVLHQRLGAPGCGNIIANEGFHLARVDPAAPAASLGRAQAGRLAYWLRAYAMRWYRDGNALQKHRLVDNRKPADGCGECGGRLVESFCYAMGRHVRAFACPVCLGQPPRPRAADPSAATWPRPRARVEAPPTAAAALLLPRGGPGGHTCGAPREKLLRCSWPPPTKWRLEYKCDASGCDARGYCDEIVPQWPTCQCAAPRNAAMVHRYSTGAHRGELFYRCRHKLTCAKFCGTRMNRLSNSGLTVEAQARLKGDFGTVPSKCPPLPCCRGPKKEKSRAKK